MTKEGLFPHPASSPTTEQEIHTENQEHEITHNCGIVGFYYNEPTTVDQAIYSLSKLQHRGQEGSGALVIPQNEQPIFWETKELLINSRKNGEFGKFRDNVANSARIIVGHNRYSTSGSLSAGQPFYDIDLITAHNGNLVNPKMLDAYTQSSESDTRVLHDSIRQSEGESLDEKIQATLPQVDGAYSLVLADPRERALYGIRDPWGMRPLHLGRLRDNAGYVIASETVAIKDIVDDLYEIQPGEGIKVQNGHVERFFQDPREVTQKSCVFEAVYFARPESNQFGLNVGEFRRACGEELAHMDYQEGVVPDIIVPIRNSGTVGAEGYSQGMIDNKIQELVDKVRKDTSLDVREQSQKIAELVLASGVSTNQYGRVFIEHGDRAIKADEKYTANPEVVGGKSVMLIDDSLVRGTTSKVITRKLREAGAKSVMWRFVSPKVIDACYWGVDFAEKEDLIAVHKSENEIADEIGADSVRFLPLDRMKDIAERLSGHDGYCTHCFSGEKPMQVNREHMIMKSDIRVKAT